MAFDDRATVATALNSAGYNTLFLGKYLNGYGAADSQVTEEELVPLRPAGLDGLVRVGATGRPTASSTGRDLPVLPRAAEPQRPDRGRAQGHLPDRRRGPRSRAGWSPSTTAPRSRSSSTSRRSPRTSAPPARRTTRPRQLWPGTGSPELFKTPARPEPGARAGSTSRSPGPPGCRADGSESQKRRQPAAAADALAPAELDRARRRRC